MDVSKMTSLRISGLGRGRHYERAATAVFFHLTRWLTSRVRRCQQPLLLTEPETVP
jgi:hypothetical protein